ncbi:hypothetical protein JMN32_19620 [Fulvivirga sp. 29W222]|uniref:Uncharacterized protein n=1 Tax=Fulvivirga marina TaxID=2494733 RepID=A0A937FYV2_9BACT|nr:hypothetical protein [Fulvivirga marina]MBL6448529.1 hypothetical protein [Fulvivirga marina]
MKRKLLSPSFYTAITPVADHLEKDEHKTAISKVDWETEAVRCYTDLVSFFEQVDTNHLGNNNIDKIGVVDICWNEYGGDIEVDFLPENDIDTAFDEGCIMNTSAIDNNVFFEQYFNISGEDSFEVIDRDYSGLIMFFYKIMGEIIGSVVKTQEFKKLPLKEPFYVTFSFFHDDERDVIFRSE